MKGTVTGMVDKTIKVVSAGLATALPRIIIIIFFIFFFIVKQLYWQSTIVKQQSNEE